VLCERHDRSPRKHVSRALAARSCHTNNGVYRYPDIRCEPCAVVRRPEARVTLWSRVSDANLGGDADQPGICQV
jgi:hypothetical protein